MNETTKRILRATATTLAGGVGAYLLGFSFTSALAIASIPFVLGILNIYSSQANKLGALVFILGIIVFAIGDERMGMIINAIENAGEYVTKHADLAPYFG